jgi:hypothetical protein
MKSKEKLLYSFKTTDFYYHPKNPAWYVNSLIIFLALAALFIFYFHYYLTATIIVLALIAMFVHASSEPKKVRVEITDRKIKFGKKKYPYSKLTSYWIYAQETYPKLYLKTSDLLFDVIPIPLGEGDPEKIGQILNDLLPQEKKGEIVSDKISRWIGY